MKTSSLCLVVLLSVILGVHSQDVMYTETRFSQSIEVGNCSVPDRSTIEVLLPRSFSGTGGDDPSVTPPEVQRHSGQFLCSCDLQLQWCPSRL